MSASYEAIFPSLRTAKPAYTPPAEYQSPDSPSAAPSGDSFAHDVMEILNPLQHIPIVSTVYRHMTGDTIGPVERIAGDTLYGGVLGLASSVANIAFEKLTGKDFGDTALAMLGIGQDKQTAVAANTSTPQPGSAADGAPAQLIKASVNADPSSPSVATSAVQNISLMDSLDRNGIGLDLDTAASTVAAVAPSMTGAIGASATNDANAAALMASLNRDGIGTDLGLRAMYAYRKSLAAPANATSAITTLH